MNQRYLNKIVFINSAHTPYAEINLDGNVHFIGTQGVGKSTLLRAILFFYNADKTKLGIASEKQKFDEFYLPYDNSYIVYEVMRENGAYTVLAFKHLGRVAFRFIDAAYDKNWLIKANGEVVQRSQLRSSIGPKIQISSLVTYYETFRDIIFGNNKSREMMAFRKFAIVESSNYKNIPRTIQNVFLNSKLDADFIKDTIISSMNDKEISIDLDVFRDLTKAFEQNYNDVMLWLKKDKQGTSPVERSATKVINDYRVLQFCDNNIAEERKELLFAEKQAVTQKPELESSILKLEAEYQRIVRLQNEEHDKYQKERDKIQNQRGALNEKLNKCRDLRKKYDEMNISQIVSRIEREAIVEQLLESAKRQKQELTQTCADITAKYNALLSGLENDRKSFVLSQNELINQKEAESNSRRNNLLSSKIEEESNLRLSFDEKRQMSNDKINKCLEDKSHLEASLRSLKYETPYNEALSKKEAELNTLNKKRAQIDSEIKLTQKDISALQNTFELKLAQVDTKESDDAQLEYDCLSEEYKKLQQLIDNQSSSLALWLDNNKLGWENDIAKVLSEDVLYSNHLEPRLSSGNSLYGVDIELNELQCNVRLPRELKEESVLLTIKLEAAKTQLDKANNAVQSKKDAIGKECKKLNREYSARLSELNIGLNQLDLEIKKINSEILGLKKQIQEWKETKTKEIKNALLANANSYNAYNEEVAKIVADYQKAQNSINNKFNVMLQVLDNELKTLKDSSNQLIRENNINLEKRKNELLSAQQRELSGRGADTEAIARYDSQIDSQNAELQFIKANRIIVYNYQKDLQDYLNNEENFKAQKKVIEDSLNSLESRYQILSAKHQSLKQQNEEELSAQKQKLESLNNSLNELKDFYRNETFCPNGSLPSEEKISEKALSELLKELKEQIINRIKLLKVFKESVGQFSGFFNINNTFSFNLELKCDNDYFDFAANLDAFVLDNKIEEFKIKVNDEYSYILLRVAKEMENLTRNESDIHKTILEINDDFVRRNFAGVIRKIELRDQPSNDKLMLLLRDIKNFGDENALQMGDMNLFAQNDVKQELNQKAADYLLKLMHSLQNDPGRKEVLLTDTFRLEFRITENDNDTGWVEKISNVGSDGTDILVKAMVNIMLINVFKEKASKKFADFKLHCMMDEIGKLHPNNVQGIIEFANSRNILLINSSPTTYSVKSYKYTYLLEKDKDANTIVRPLISML